MEQRARDAEEPVRGDVREALERIGSTPSTDAVARPALVDRLRADPGAAGIPAGRSEAAPPAEAVRRISWQRTLALLLLGCLALGVALGCSAVALGFLLAAVLEPHDVLLAAREALCAVLLLGAAVSAGLAWAVVAAVGYGTGARASALQRREALLRRPGHTVEVAPG